MSLTVDNTFTTLCKSVYSTIHLIINVEDPMSLTVKVLHNFVNQGQGQMSTSLHPHDFDNSL